MWFKDVFLSGIRKFTTRKVALALVMDNASSSHDSLIDPKNQVTLYKLPPNCTSVHQPRDLGIIASLKKKYRYTLLDNFMSHLDHLDELREIGKKKNPGLRGLKDGFPPNVLDAAEIIHEAWQKIPIDTLLRCWVKADILDDKTKARLNLMHGKTKYRQKHVSF